MEKPRFGEVRNILRVLCLPNPSQPTIQINLVPTSYDLPPPIEMC